MNKNYYPTQKTFVKYDDDHFLLYLNEEIVEDYLPENAEDGAVPFTAYAYSGTEPDGSTKIKAAEATYQQFVSGLIRTEYSADAVEAIMLNYQSYSGEEVGPNGAKNKEIRLEWEDFNDFRQECKEAVALLLEME